MLYWMCEKTEVPLTGPQLLHAIKRNFGGLEDKNLDPVEIFRQNLPRSIDHPPDLSNLSLEMHPFVNPDVTQLGLIKASLKTREKSWHGENRYLLFLTENYAALEILKHYLRDQEGQQHPCVDHPEERTLKPWEMEPFVLYGSSFPRDKEFDQVCRNINQIKIYMEIGRTVILLNLENLYESLYDVLNQYYIHHGGNRYVDLGLQTHKVKCRIHEEFKLIMIAEKNTVYNEFPTPLINRLEKHFVLYSSILEEWQVDTLNQFEEWIESFSHISSSNSRFTERDAFVGYQKDVAAAVVFQASSHLKKLWNNVYPLWKSAWENGLLGDFSLEAIREKEGLDKWKQAVLLISQFLLLQITSPAALVRLKNSTLRDQLSWLHQLYRFQHHASIKDFLTHFMSHDHSGEGLLLQVTTHSHLLLSYEVEALTEGIVHSYLLQEFDTELDFINKVSPLFVHGENSHKDCLVVIQCDSGHINSDLIACARYHVSDMRAKANKLDKANKPDDFNFVTHVLFIIHLPVQAAQSSFVGFQSEPWVSYHIDELRDSDHGHIIPEEAQKTSISELFYGAQQPNMKGADIYKQCVRLNSCIQAAASQLHDSTWNKHRAAKRVELLIKAIPHDPKFPLDPHSFYGILVSHIHRILKERGSSFQDTDWVLDEAMSLRHLQMGGTFMNVLTRKLNDVIIPIFSEVIAFLDHNCNLSLFQAENTDSPLSQFWLKTFCSKQAEQALHFDDMVAMQKVPMIGEEFRCQFPFSWLFQELFNSIWDIAQSTGGSSTRQMHAQLCVMVSDTPLGVILSSIQDSRQCEELYQRYLHDFVHSVHKCPHRLAENVNNEYKLIQDSLHNMVIRDQEFRSLDGGVTLTTRIAAVHIVHRATCEHIHWFGQLTSYSPGILSGMVQEELGKTEGMMLHLYAVERVLNGLKPPLEPKRQSAYSSDDTVRNWLNSLQRCSIAIESTLSLSKEHFLARKASLKWQKIRAIQMFAEHVLLNHGNTFPFATRLNTIMGEQADFLQLPTLKIVQRFLNNVYAAQKEDNTSKEGRKQLAAFRKSCHNFFIDVVSVLCFGQSSAPTDDLIEMLLDNVFTEGRVEAEDKGGERGKWRTRTLSPYKAERRDKSPTVRSFLLQLLLEHNTEKAKGHLRNYFDRSQQTLVGEETVDLDLCLLCTQCFEDALHRENSGHPFGHRMEVAIKLVTCAIDTLTQFAGFTQSNVSVEVLEAVAKMRYALLVITELLQLRVDEMREASLTSHSHNLYGTVASTLLDKARCACTAERINVIGTSGKSNTVGPIVYLLRLLVRQAGFSFLNKMVNEYSWVVPMELRKTEEERTLDPFVIYNQVYLMLRRRMRIAAYHKDYRALEESTVTLQPQEYVPLILSVYMVVTMSRTSDLLSRQLLPEVLQKLNMIIGNCKALPEELKLMVRRLVFNQYSGALAALHVTPSLPSDHRMLSAIVIHTVAALLGQKKIDLLCPLVTLLSKPGDMARAYLPTMPEDMLSEARRVISVGQFYECPNRHPYLVSECGRPMQQINCYICGSAIGGQNHKLVKKNKEAKINDATQRGHCLGHPTVREHVPSPERVLSPAACCILRAIMHSALLWASCNMASASRDLVALVMSGLQGAKKLPDFFWGHLEKDVQLLARAIGKNQEDAATVVHLVLQNMVTSKSEQGTLTPALKNLESKTARNQWENHFGQTYINPVLEKLEELLDHAMSSILKDDKKVILIDDDPLFYLVYERMPVVEGSLEPHLWGYRPRVTLEHLTRYMQQQNTKFPVLEKFLSEEAVLQATQYLPNIVCLQRRIFDIFHLRIDHKQARRKTMREFIKSRHSENKRKEYREMVTSVQCAWVLVRNKLKDHAQLRVKEEYLQHDISLDTTLDYFIPTTIGPGACTFALVHYLTYVHNNFIDWCRAHNKAKPWQEHKIQLPHIHKCHLLDYQSQLQSILLSHCHYSLHVGSGHEVTYDLPALEKHILDRFIHGKPTILVDIPHVSYRKDVYTAATFAVVRKKVAKQVSLAPRVQMDILQELGSPDKLRRSLDVVDIVLGFLTSSGGKPETKLLTYLKKLKMEKKTFSEKAKEHCNLEHILSLWETLSVGLARYITLSDQEPFDTLNSELLTELTETQQQQLLQVLNRFDLESILGTLYEFIETYLRHIDMSHKEWGLVETLEAHLEWNDLVMPSELKELPKDITLAQTVATWKYVVKRGKTSQ